MIHLGKVSEETKSAGTQKNQSVFETNLEIRAYN
jgi:hypothetical protein